MNHNNYKRDERGLLIFRLSINGEYQCETTWNEFSEANGEFMSELELANIRDDCRSVGRSEWQGNQGMLCTLEAIAL
jgi:hypothetical protein